MCSKRRRKRDGSTEKWERRSALVLLGGIAGGIAVGIGGTLSGAFDTATVSRGFDLRLSDDDSALLDITVKQPNGTDGDRVELLELTNNFPDELNAIAVTDVSSSRSTIDIVDTQSPDSLETGSEGIITGELVCDSELTAVPVELEASASGNHQSIEFRRSIEVTCNDDAFDPFDCQDVWNDGESHCDYFEGATLELDGETRDGNVCMADSDDVYVELEEAARIDGFLRVESGDETDLALVAGSIVDKTVVLNACGDVDVELDEESIIYGDICIKVGEDVDLFVEEDSTVYGDVKIDADGDVEIEADDGGEIRGETKTEWESGWGTDHC